MIPTTNLQRAVFASLFIALTATVPAQNNPPAPAVGHDTDALAKEVANPVSSLISFPIQENLDIGFAGGGWRSTTNIQPVYPSTLNENWKMINHAILPVIYQDDVTHNGTDFGLADTMIENFFSPSKHSANAPTGASAWFSECCFRNKRDTPCLDTSPISYGNILTQRRKDAEPIHNARINYVFPHFAYSKTPRLRASA